MHMAPIVVTMVSAALLDLTYALQDAGGWQHKAYLGCNIVSRPTWLVLIQVCCKPIFLGLSLSLPLLLVDAEDHNACT